MNIRSFILWLILMLVVFGPAHAASTPRRQYIFLNRSATSGNWFQNNPDSITDALFDNPIAAIGTTPTGNRRLGLSFMLYYLHYPPDKLECTLRRLLALSQKHDIPVLIALDGQTWWGNRPDLWNWWDPSLPGYDPANRSNVEWTGWEPQDAVKLGWRNWGRQIRVLPEPNLASPKFREASRTQLMRLLGIIKQWRDHLPADKRYLYPGIKVGSEASVGINAYYYPNGNSYLEQFPNDPTHDPKTGLDMSKDFAGGAAPLGYAALTSLGWKHTGPITVEDQGRIVENYLSFLAHVCRRAGLGRQEIFTHAGGQFQPAARYYYSHSVAMNKDSIPGYSFYWDVDPRHAGDLGALLDASRQDDWCAAEWLPAAHTSEQWATAYDATLSFHQCISVYNWEGIQNSAAAIAGLRLALTHN